MVQQRGVGISMLPVDAQQAQSDCQAAADQVAQIDVGANTLALDARDQLHSALLDIVTAAQDDGSAFADLQNGQYDSTQYDAGDALLRAANAAYDSAAREMQAASDDLGGSL